MDAVAVAVAVAIAVLEAKNSVHLRGSSAGSCSVGEVSGNIR